MSVRAHSVRRSRAAGFTLIEVMIALTLVGLISTAMLVALRVALNTETKADARLMANRRVMGAQNAIQQELNSFMPEIAIWRDTAGAEQHAPFFGGDPASMRFVSSYSLNEASRGLPQLLEFAVIPGENAQGVRLIVNELPYRGGYSAGARVAGFENDGSALPRLLFFPVVAGAGSFVLADHLAYCHFLYLEQLTSPPRELWRADWVARTWPVGVRIEMAPLSGEEGSLHPVSVTATLHAYRDPDKKYKDEPGLE